MDFMDYKEKLGREWNTGLHGLQDYMDYIKKCI